MFRCQTDVKLFNVKKCQIICRYSFKITFKKDLLIHVKLKVYKPSEYCENAHQRFQIVKNSKGAPEEPEAGLVPVKLID